MRKLLLIVPILYLFTACSSKQKEQYNKSALFWYNKMLKEISLYQFDKADDTFTSLESEHRNSSLLPSALMVIATTHMDNEEYELAIYYFDEYIKRFEDPKKQDYVRFLKIKAKYFAFKQQFREQQLITDTLSDIDKFIQKYPNSSYIYLVKTIQSRLYMAKASFDKEIAGLYTRIDKPKASVVYKQKAKKSWQDIDTIKPVDVPWYRWIFE